MPTGYCEPEDVLNALQDTSLSGATNESIVSDAIHGVSSWLRKETGSHWYDSSGPVDDLTPTAARSASNVRLDVPSSPHAQRRQIMRAGSDVRYPVTTDGPYARIPLPHSFVESVDRLAVRDRAGGVDDWVASSDHPEGVGEDYYAQEEDAEGYGASYLYVRAASVGPRTDYSGVLTLEYSYGLDEQDESWEDVRRGVALLSAAQVIVDDNVLTMIPDNGSLIGVDTQAQRLYDRAMQYLDGYLGVALA